MTLNFEQVDVPAQAVTRKSEPNPFDGVFPADEKALRLTVDAPADSKEVRKLISQARKAASAVERTGRVKAETTGSGKNTKTALTFWTVPKITRERKPAENTEEK